jgi:gas vesicle protein
LTSSACCDRSKSSGQQKRDTAAAKAARSRLEVYEKKTGAKITSQTLPFLREQVQSGKSDIKPRELQQIERLVKQAEGLE